MIDDKIKRINIKSKRRSTLVNKVIELSQLCDLDILLVINDTEMNKVIEYNSGTERKGHFTLEDATREIMAARSGLKLHKKLDDDSHGHASKLN